MLSMSTSYTMAQDETKVNRNLIDAAVRVPVKHTVFASTIPVSLCDEAPNRRVPDWKTSYDTEE
jgi:nucleoside-diphosphate-sugar epimerase